MAITVVPVTPSFAAEVGDVDLSRPLEAADVTAIKEAFAAIVAEEKPALKEAGGLIKQVETYVSGEREVPEPGRATTA